MNFTTKPLWMARIYRKRMFHIWSANVFLAVVLVSTQILISYLSGANAGPTSTQNLKSEPFDGVIAPIAQIPDWSIGYTDKKLRFDDIPKNVLINLPAYDPNELLLAPTSRSITNARYTFITPYMGSYRGNYEEHDGSHLAVDIRAPLGTPVLSVANAIVSRVKIDPSGDGIYVVLKHDGVPLNDGNSSMYSAYLHLEDATVTLGQKIQKGTVIGHVWMTGITTTPHLHFQIDRANAPFHPYWPYDSSDLRSAGISFFEWVNTGLGKDKAELYTYNPMNFVQGKLTTWVANNTPILSSAPTQPSQSLALESDTKIRTNKPNTVVIPPVAPPPKLSESLLASNGNFKDIDPNSSLKNAVAYLKERGVVNGYPDGSFGVERNVTRKESVLLISRLFGIQVGEWISTPFSDIPKTDSFARTASRFVDLGILKAQGKFRPNDIVTKWELATMLVRASSLSPVVSPNIYSDVSESNSLRPYLNSYALQTNTSGKFNADTIITRGQTAEMLYGWAERGKGWFALNLD